MADQRDWDKELAKIDRLMAKDGGTARPAPGPAEAGAVPARQGGAEQSAAPAPKRQPAERPATGGRGGFAVWLITLLGPIGVAALTVWPYPRDCGFMLWVYLVGVAGVLAAAIWGMRNAWQSRRGLPMAIGIVTLLAALVLVAAEVLPRIGYAAHSLTWTCST